jgi:hypothetical protein
VGSPKDESGSGEQKEETPQQEIDVSAADNQVSTEPTPDASISIDTQILDERQTEVGPSNTGKKFKNPVLNKYIPSGAWEICSPGEINKSPSPWMNSLTYMPSLMTRKGKYCEEDHQEEEDHSGSLHPHHHGGKYDKHRACQNI